MTQIQNRLTFVGWDGGKTVAWTWDVSDSSSLRDLIIVPDWLVLYRTGEATGEVTCGGATLVGGAVAWGGGVATEEPEFGPDEGGGAAAAEVADAELFVLAVEEEPALEPDFLLGTVISTSCKKKVGEEKKKKTKQKQTKNIRISIDIFHQ